MRSSIRVLVASSMLAAAARRASSRGCPSRRRRRRTRTRSRCRAGWRSTVGHGRAASPPSSVPSASCRRRGWNGRRASNSTETTPQSGSGRAWRSGSPPAPGRACRGPRGCVARCVVADAASSVQSIRRLASTAGGSPRARVGAAALTPGSGRNRRPAGCPRATSVSANSICRATTSATAAVVLVGGVQVAVAQVVGAGQVVEQVVGVDDGDVGVEAHRVGDGWPSTTQCAHAPATASGSIAGGRSSTMSLPGRSRPTGPAWATRLRAACRTRSRAPGGRGVLDHLGRGAHHPADDSRRAPRLMSWLTEMSAGRRAAGGGRPRQWRFGLEAGEHGHRGLALDRRSPGCGDGVGAHAPILLEMVFIVK